MTQAELFQRLSGQLSLTVTVKLLNSVHLPWIPPATLDEVAYPGYAPSIASVVQASTPTSFPQASFEGTADFYNAATKGEWYVEGCAVFLDDATGTPILFGISQFDNRYVVPYGNFTINFSVNAQSFVGSA